MCQYALYLDLVQFRALRARICRFLRRHPEYRRRRSRAGLTISEMLRLTLAAFRHNLRQRLLAWVFKVHQSTVCRVVAWMRGVLAEVLADLVPGGGDIAAVVSGLLSSTGRPIIALVDGTLVPVSQRRATGPATRGSTAGRGGTSRLCAVRWGTCCMWRPRCRADTTTAGPWRSPE